MSTTVLHRRHRPRATTRRATRPDTAAAEWSVWTTTARLVVTDPAVLPAARALVEERLAAVDAAASRFRPGSEVVRAAAASLAGAPVRVSALLADLVEVALDAAERTSGAVDPTLGHHLEALGYDDDLDVVRARTAAPAAGPAAPFRLVRATAGTDPAALPRPSAAWRGVVVLPGADPDGSALLWLPAGVLLDLGATAKARAADLCAHAVVERFGGGALVSIGGDVATAGREPSGGWQVRVQDGDGEPASLLAVGGVRGVATSSTLHRRWATPAGPAHHVLDPATGLPAEPVWRTASVVAPSCAEANALSTAALVLGAAAPAWLAEQHATARLVGDDGDVVLVGPWPAEPVTEEQR
ncbi:FAD:protein FMN transferase [Quadrisphaera sp. INWT6]|uniref:FAD:protein FMN transferase n=1 Tax=Quadrisphaera sp. INWT6 TaxID=2596917 RepID=UPI00189249B7|nr:FAD:protein FMN transferase [Quadrisphaera sp. INWT6]MBF5081220.1 FAD:protein FMN transferase [Quadrisphaera sp. INWT6]